MWVHSSPDSYRKQSDLVGGVGVDCDVDVGPAGGVDGDALVDGAGVDCDDDAGPAAVVDGAGVFVALSFWRSPPPPHSGQSSLKLPMPMVLFRTHAKPAEAIVLAFIIQLADNRLKQLQWLHH